MNKVGKTIKFISSMLLAAVILTGCGNDEAIQVMDINKGEAVVVKDDVVFTHNGKTYTAKGEASSFERTQGNYFRAIVYKNGTITINE